VKQKSFYRMLWDMISEDKSLIFMIMSVIGFVVSFVDGNFSWYNIVSLAIFFIASVYYIYRTIMLLRSLLTTKHLPIVVVTGKDLRYAREVLGEAKDAIAKSTGFKDFKRLEEFFRVSFEYEALIHNEENLNPADTARWIAMVDKIQTSARQVGARIPGEKVYHLFLFGIGITSLAAGVGAAFGTKPKVIVYQPSGGSDWEPVLDLSHDARRIKEVVERKDYKYLDCKWPSKIEPETALVLNMAGHSASPYVQQYLQQKQLPKVSFIEVDNKYQGNLKEDDWAPAVQELFIIYSLARKGASKIHLFLNMPTAMAYGLGVAMGNYNEVIIYCWDGKTYHQVFALNQIKSLL